jgi:type II secretory pathway predicted ATPase ExeA
MYEAFFKLHSRPFLAAPQTSRYFPAAVIESARKTLARCIERGEGAGLLIGPVGTGKTLLCQMLSEAFHDEFSVALLTSGRLATRRALLQAILYELGLPFRGIDEGELRLSLLDHLEPTPQGNHGLLLLVDEAHTLPWRLLEEIRLITNLVRDGQSRVRVILAGGPILEERFASPKLSSFSQRLAARCYLESLDSAETAAFVRAQIASVGGDPAQLFHDEALHSVHRATDGIPRLINQVCDHALILASLGGLCQLTSETIEEAWADLQQLPTPFSTVRANDTGAGQIVEFGGLNDAQDEMPEAIPFRAAPSQRLHVAQPDEQLEAIHKQVSQMAAEFQPIGSRDTEIELDFPEFGDPLGEKFAEEEVVLDRYNSEMEIFADVPRVSSVEGQQLGSMLPPSHATRPRGAESRRPIIKVTPVGTKGVTAQSNLPPAASSTPGSDPAAPQASNVSEGFAVDQDLIVVEDDPVSGPLLSHPVPLVRKLEYRQLFARLRRG